MAAVDGSGALWTFDGSPAAPQPWRPTDWDVTVHSRDTQTFTTLEAMDASHGTDCGAPPATHRTSSYEGAVFLCKDHVMTAMNASGYGLIYLTPPAMADWAPGESVVRWDMSTLRTSPRDWVDLWVVPYEDDLQLALDEWIPDGNGLPRRAIHIRMDNGGSDNHNSIFRVELIDDFQNVWQYEGFHPGLEDEFRQRGLATSASRRDTFELRLQKGHVALAMPQYGITFADTVVPGLTWTRGVVSFGHHSYNPGKDCSASGTITCLPGTWHVDNFAVTPAVPMTIIRAERRYADATHATPFVLGAPAPAGAVLRFTAIGNAIQVSYDGGRTWQGAVAQAGSKPAPMGNEHFQSYRMPIPAGTTRVSVRGQAWFAGGWEVQALSVWAQNAQGGTPSVTATVVPTPTSTATPSATPTSFPTTTSTPTSISTSTTTPTPITTSTPSPEPSVSSPTTTPTMPSATATPSPSSPPTLTPTTTSVPFPTTPTPTSVPPTAPPLDVACRLDGNILTCVLPAAQVVSP